MSSRLDTLISMLERNPGHSAARFGLAMEYLNAGRREDAVRELRTYLEQADDEGNAYGRLGHALRQLGRDEEAREAYHQGIAAAERHGHPTRAEEFREVLASWS